MRTQLDKYGCVYDRIRQKTEQNGDCMAFVYEGSERVFCSPYITIYDTKRHTIVIWGHINRRIYPYTVIYERICLTWYRQASTTIQLSSFSPSESQSALLNSEGMFIFISLSESDV